ncbi:MAG: ATP-dependent Clp protease ATP-binding subunit [Chlamydiae bacterium]|nr:ATP-dependent Clp protease ATP-binding subunit [Chlamydiota bacterium]MBI3277116.1 ATP-dependent Clp protease ATP-binding subunit [Chlamydiota bacterium]
MSFVVNAQKSRILVAINENSTELVKGPIVGRDDIVEKVQRSLLRLSRPNIVLVGPKGIGVKAVLGAVARSIVKGTGIKELDRFKPMYLDVTQAVNEHKFEDTINKFIDGLLEELAQDKDLLLVIDYAEHLMFDLFNFPRGVRIFGDRFYGLVGKSKLVFIGGMSSQYYNQNISFFNQKWGSMLDFIQLPELSPEDTFHALKETMQERERMYDVSISEEVLKSCIYLSHKYVQNSIFPAKAIYLLDESMARLKMKNRSSKGLASDSFSNLKPELVLNEAIVVEAISDLTGLPLGQLSVSDLKLLRDFEGDMVKRIIGQDKAVKAVAQAIRAVRAGFGCNNRPDGIFYFLGPSGVGKTEFALCLSEVLYGRQDRLIRIDMSEFVNPSDVTRLIGASPGYVGYDKGGVLTEWAKKNPMSIILLDEFEKAHPGCWDVFLQLFDAGRLTDGQGTTVDFSNTIIIMTSNIGSELFFDHVKKIPLGFSSDDGDVHGADFDDICLEIQKRLKNIFRPEFLNRIDEAVVFRPLDLAALAKIASLMLKKFPVKFYATDEVIQHLAVSGYEPQYGARHLRRTIQSLIIEPIANLIVEGKLKQGEPVKITLENGAFQFERVAELNPANTRES